MHRGLKAHTPAGSDGAVEPGGVLVLIGSVFRFERRDVKHRKAVVYVAFHAHLTLRLVGVHVHEPWDHVRGESYNESLKNSKHRKSS